jgi:hypothetical protein
MTSNALVVRSALLRAITGDIFQPNFQCPHPARNCSWDEFTTLGVCYDTRNLTGMIRPNCSERLLGEGLASAYVSKCVYDVPAPEAPQLGGNYVPPNWYHWPLELSFPRNSTEAFKTSYLWNSPQKTIFNTSSKMLGGGNRNAYNEGAYFTTVKLFYDNNLIFNNALPIVEILTTRWYLCAQTFRNVTASPTELFFGDMVSEPLLSDNGPYGTFSGIHRFKANSTEKQFSTKEGAKGIWHALAIILDNRAIWKIPGNSSSPLDTIRSGDNDNDYAEFLYKVDHAELVDNVAKTATNLIRSTKPGDNNNATMFKGKADYQELFYEVRWQWLILPLAEVVAIVVLLGISIFLTRNQPLFKTSVAAYLLHGLDGWSERELASLIPDMESVETLDHVTKDMVAFLQRDGDGRLKFKRA